VIGRLNHVAIAVPDLEHASETYKRSLGAEVSEPLELPEHGVRVVFVSLTNTKIELLEPLGVDSPISKFLTKSPSGGIHHVCYEVDDIYAARDALVKDGARILNKNDPVIGAHGKPVIFLNPKDFNGVLIELEQS